MRSYESCTSQLAYLTLVFACAAAFAPGCSDDDPGLQQGTAGGACYPNGTCNDGLVCQGGVCVDAGSTDGALAPDGGADGSALPDQKVLPLVWTACDTSSWPSGYPKPATGVECTTIQVPLDHSLSGGKTLTLRVGRHKSQTYPTGKAVFNLAGGPGGAATYQSGTIPLYMPKLLQTFDLIYVDQRGTGGSGHMACSAGYPQTKQEWSCSAGR